MGYQSSLFLFVPGWPEFRSQNSPHPLIQTLCLYVAKMADSNPPPFLRATAPKNAGCGELTNTYTHSLYLLPAPHHSFPNLHHLAATELCLALCYHGNNVASPKWDAGCQGPCCQRL